MAKENTARTHRQTHKEMFRHGNKETLSFMRTWVELEGSRLSEIKSDKDKYCMLSQVEPKSRSHSNREQNGGWRLAEIRRQWTKGRSLVIR